MNVWTDFKPMIRTITWKCGHEARQRLTKLNPHGATIPPRDCPICGVKGIRKVEDNKE